MDNLYRVYHADSETEFDILTLDDLTNLIKHLVRNRFTKQEVEDVFITGLGRNIPTTYKFFENTYLLIEKISFDTAIGLPIKEKSE